MYRASQKRGVLPIGRRTYEVGEAIDTEGLSEEALDLLVRRGLIQEEPEKKRAPAAPRKEPKAKQEPKAEKKKAAPKKKRSRKK